jgi:hypothetical protein
VQDPQQFAFTARRRRTLPDVVSVPRRIARFFQKEDAECRMKIGKTISFEWVADGPLAAFYTRHCLSGAEE